MLKRLTAVLLLLSLSVSLPSALPSASAAGTASYNGIAYSTEYTQWKQTSAAWSKLPLGTGSNTMAKSGCLVNAIAIQMCRAGCYDPAQFNPGVLVTWFNQMGYTDSAGNLDYTKMTAATCPRFVFAGRLDLDSSQYGDISILCKAIQEKQAAGYSVIARVNSTTGRAYHFVVVDYALSTKDARIIDAVNGKTLLSDYSSFMGLLYFKPNPSAADTILKTTSSASTTTTTTTTSTTSATTSTTPAATTTPVAATTPTTTTPATNSTGSGGATTGSDSSALSASSGSSTATMVTITYDYGWINIGKTTQALRSGSNYSLHTPSRDNAAFLGWYRDGKLVTNSSIVPNVNHTLVAKWDTKGFSFPAGDPYDGRFTDISPSRWYYDNVTTIYSYGLMNGTTDTTFQPDMNLPFQQAVTIACRVYKQYHDGNMDFEIYTKPWYMTYLYYGSEVGLFDSYPEDLDKAKPISRYEFAKMLARALPKSALPQVNSVAEGSIPDVYKGDTDIYRLYRAGILQGSDASGAFKPNDFIKRNEVATILTRIVDPNTRLLFTM